MVGIRVRSQMPPTPMVSAPLAATSRRFRWCSQQDNGTGRLQVARAGTGPFRVAAIHHTQIRSRRCAATTDLPTGARSQRRASSHGGTTRAPHRPLRGTLPAATPRITHPVPRLICRPRRSPAGALLCSSVALPFKPCTCGRGEGRAPLVDLLSGFRNIPISMKCHQFESRRPRQFFPIPTSTR
jgi:hypothetical protein